MLRAHELAVLAAVCVLASCNSVQNLQSVKSQDYASVPKNIYGYVQPSTFANDKAIESFKKEMAEGLAECGIRLQFKPGTALAVSPPAGTDAVMEFRELGHEMVTHTGGSTGFDQYNDMYRVEVSLMELSSKKVVWKGQGDFRTQDNKKAQFIPSMPQASASFAWSRNLVGQMRKDNLLGECRSSDAIAPTAIASASVSPALAAPVSAAAPVAVTPTKPGSWKIGNVAYGSLAEAEAGMRASNAQEAAQIIPFPVTPRDSLVIVALPVKKANVPGQTPEQLEQIDSLIRVINQVGYDAAVDAIRKSNLFKQVTLVRDEELPDSDFKGAAYKMSFSSGSWGVARAGGTRQKVPAPVLNDFKIAKVNAYLNSLQQAISAADGA